MTIEIRPFSNPAAKSYEEFVVIFIDILGFSDAVGQSESNLEKQELLIELFELLKQEIKEGKIEEREGYRFIETPMTLFSDSILVPLPIRCISKFNLYSFAASIVEKIQCKLLTQGFLSRGAITIGKAYYDYPICFGPAVIEAVKLEKDKAKYPRVIFSKAFENYKFYNKVQDIYHSLNDSIGDNIHRDDDNIFYVNYLSLFILYWKTMEEARKTQRQINNAVSSKISEDRFTKEDRFTNKVSIKEKIEWFNKYFEDSIKKNKVYLDYL